MHWEQLHPSSATGPAASVNRLPTRPPAQIAVEWHGEWQYGAFVSRGHYRDYGDYPCLDYRQISFRLQQACGQAHPFGVSMVR